MKNRNDPRRRAGHSAPAAIARRARGRPRSWRGAAAAARLAVAAAACCCGWLPGGCAGTGSKHAALPSKHVVRGQQLEVVSDFKIPRDHPLIADLHNLREQVSESLELPLGDKPVVVYLFSNELEYAQCLHARFPDYPARRAYFIETSSAGPAADAGWLKAAAHKLLRKPSGGKELSVYTWWGDQIQEDLRHEFTHGLLHSTLRQVPLWLDEGLAEYFEVPGASPGRLNPEHAQMLATAAAHGWKPDLARLELLEQVEEMQRADYREAWAWVHFMLHHSPDTRRVLIDYLHELRTNPRPGRLRERLEGEIPQLDQRLIGYVSGLNVNGTRGARRAAWP